MTDLGSEDLKEIERLRASLVDSLGKRLSPLAQRYGLSDVPLESRVKGRPLVLILGNYSSGKSTLINEFLGGAVQATGQAPTDDAFTVLTGAEGGAGGGAVRVVQEQDGSALLANGDQPFQGLSRHGSRFASHLRLKYVNSPFLKHLSIIDTPGMLGGADGKGRGYDYQAVIGDLAELADLVLVLFDPHKAGTIAETHASLKHTLPAKTFEDRVVFVMNRIDECDNLGDLLRVYGSLCWNLAQSLGRKDIPQIRLTYAPKREPLSPGSYLSHLANQREELKSEVAAAPRYRLDHLAAYAELHGARLKHFLQALTVYKQQRRRHYWSTLTRGIVTSLVVAVVVAGILIAHGLSDPSTVAGAAGLALIASLAVWFMLLAPLFSRRHHQGLVHRVDELTALKSDQERERWASVKHQCSAYLSKEGKVVLKDVRSDLATVEKFLENDVATTRGLIAKIAARGAGQAQ